MHVQAERVALQIRQDRRIRLSRKGNSGVSQRVEGCDPGRDRCREGLAEEGPEWHVLPRLDVAGAPVVEDHDTEEMVGRPVDGEARAELCRAADDVAELGLDVEADARAEDRSGVLRALALPARPHDLGARDDDRAGPAVVADRQVLPVRGEGRVVGPEDLADVARMVLARVEVDVVGDLDRQVQRHAVERDEVRLDPCLVHVVAEDLGEPLARDRPRRSAEREEGVEARIRPRLSKMRSIAGVAAERRHG